ncbi:MAG TPA: geranylgeranyl reductase family protein [Acidimicrobiales bacterium]|nr:geranylgeranyl reductase family protein [Acidimicrobiales bacterium]
MTRSQGTLDVAVVGAGPAGSAAATTIARAGASVVLIDRARFPRDKTCGDGLTTGALRRLESLGVGRFDVAPMRAVTELAVRSPSGRTVFLPFPKGRGAFAAVARRHDLDAQLVEVARSAGSLVEEGSRCTGVERSKDQTLRLNLSTGKEIRCRYVIAADGAWSDVRKLTGAERRLDATPPRPDWMAFRAYVNGARQEALKALWVWFSPDLLPGYAWSFPLADGSVNVGIAARAANGRSLAGFWRRALASPFLESLLGPRAELEAPARAWPIPTRLHAAPLSAFDGSILFAGDAAGAADPFTGEGIGQALESGILAAEAIVDSGDSPGAAAEHYGRVVSCTIGRDHHLASVCHRLFSHPVGAKAVLRFVDSGSFVRRNVARWLFEDYPRAIAASPFSWPEAFRHREGAWTGA